MKENKDITVRQVIDAIRKNGYKHIRNNLFINSVYGMQACALGTAYLNLGLYDENGRRNKTFNYNFDSVIETLVIQLNDTDGYSLNQIADYLEKEYVDKLDDIVYYGIRDYQWDWAEGVSQS